MIKQGDILKDNQGKMWVVGNIEIGLFDTIIPLKHGDLKRTIDQSEIRFYKKVEVTE